MKSGFEVFNGYFFFSFIAETSFLSYNFSSRPEDSQERMGLRDKTGGVLGGNTMEPRDTSLTLSG